MTEAEKDTVADLAVEILEVVRRYSSDFSKLQVLLALRVAFHFVKYISKWPEQVQAPDFVPGKKERERVQ